MPSDFEPHVIDNPPMPWQEYRDRAFREWARKVAILGFVILIVTLILIPWGQL